MVTLFLFDFLCLGSNSRMRFSSYKIYLEGKNEGEIQNVHGGFLLFAICIKSDLLQVWSPPPPPSYPEDLL